MRRKTSISGIPPSCYGSQPSREKQADELRAREWHRENRVKFLTGEEVLPYGRSKETIEYLDEVAMLAAFAQSIQAEACQVSSNILKSMTKERREQISNMAVLNGGVRDELLMHLSASDQKIEGLKRWLGESWRLLTESRQEIQRLKISEAEQQLAEARAQLNRMRNLAILGEEAPHEHPEHVFRRIREIADEQPAPPDGV